jgi:hypothetical protein
MPTKTILMFLLVLHYFSEIKSQKEVTKQKEIGIKVFLNISAWWQKDPNPYLWLKDPDPRGPKTCESGGSGSATLTKTETSFILLWWRSLRPWPPARWRGWTSAVVCGFPCRKSNADDPTATFSASKRKPVFKRKFSKK